MTGEQIIVEKNRRGRETRREVMTKRDDGNWTLREEQLVYDGTWREVGSETIDDVQLRFEDTNE